MSASQALQHLYSLDKSSSEFLRAVYKFTRLDENGECSFNLQQSESARLVDFLDEALDSIPVTDALFRRCLRRLRQVCGYHNILPSSHIISAGLSITGKHAAAYGGFADVWEGMLGSEKVCVKVLRIYNAKTNDQKQALAPFYGEAVVWKRLRHPNVVPFLGVTTAPFQLVSRWMPNGTLTDYVNAKPRVHRISLLLDVAEGLNYLHTCHMVHGDLKGPNILIDASGHARVCDFGLASVAHGKYTTGLKSDKGHTARWSAPEILFGECTTSKQADIFAFGMVVIEAFTGSVPFHTLISSAVTWKVMNGDRPHRPYEARELGLTDPVWRMTECCWQQPPKDRLKASEVVDLLREIYAVPSNDFLVNAISGTPGSVGSDPTILQTEAALSPRLLEILHYRESHKRTLSDTTPSNDGRRTAASNLPERPTSAPVYWESRQHGVGGIMQRLSVVDPVQDGPSPSSAPGSDSVSTAVDESWRTAESTFQDPTDSNNSPKPIDNTWNPPESKVTIPKISAQTDGFAHPGGSSSTIVDGPEYQVDLGTNRRANDVRSGRGIGDVRNGRGDNDARKVGDAKKPVPLRRQVRKSSHLSAIDPEPLVVEPTPSRSSSNLRRGLGGGPLAGPGPGGGGSKPPTRSATPTSELGNQKGQERGGTPRPSDTPPQQTTPSNQGPGRWGRVRAVARVLGLYNKRIDSRSNDTREQ